MKKRLDNDTRNYFLIFTDTVLFINAMTFLAINTVITYFLSNLGATTFQISLASAMVSICTFASQPIFAKKAMVLPYKHKTFASLLFTQRFIFLGFIMLIPFLAVSNPGLTVILFLVFWAIFNFFVGSYSPFFMGLFSKMIPNRQRGRLGGYSAATGNIIALGSTYIVGILLDKVAFPYNYTYIFLIGIFILIADAFVFLFLKETPDQIEEENISYLNYIKQIPKTLKNDRQLLKIIIGNSFIAISNVGLAYYTLYAIRAFNIKSEQIPIFTAISITINIIGNIILGILADKKGHRLVLQISCVCGMLAGLSILSIKSIYAIYAAFALSSLCSSGYMLSSGVYIIQNSPAGKVPLYISINNIITLMLSSIIILLNSYIIDKLSFMPIFFTTAVGGFCGFLIYSRYLSEVSNLHNEDHQNEVKINITPVE